MAVHGTNAVRLQALTEKHHHVAALLAQGLGRTEISRIVDFTPEYVTWLMRDPLFQQYMSEMVEFSQMQVEAMFCRSVGVIGETLEVGDQDQKLKAARLQLEVTGRVGKVERAAPTNEDSINRLTRLAERLATTLNVAKRGEVIDVQVERQVEQIERQVLPVPDSR